MASRQALHETQTKRPLGFTTPGGGVLFGIVGGLVALAFIPSLKLGSALWRLPAHKVIAIGCIGASFALSAVLFAQLRVDAGRTTWRHIIAIPAISYSPTLLFLIMTKSDFSRVALATELALSALLIGALFIGEGLGAVRAVILIGAASVGIAIQVGFATGKLPLLPKPALETGRLYSALYELRVDRFKNFLGWPPRKGGGLTVLGDRYLLGTGAGDLYFVKEGAASHEIDLAKLPYRVPLNAAEFEHAVKGVNTDWFRTADVLAQIRGTHVRLFASHHYWKASERCFVVRVSMLEGTSSDFVERRSGMTWQTVFESAPCVPVEFEGRPPIFVGLQIGGRLAAVGEEKLLLTLGDNGLDGWNAPLSMPQDPATSYGKTILIDLANHTSRVYTLGHRNPQGLAIDTAGKTWLTEHGPQGGDELNLLSDGANYGSPLVTYGVEYGSHSWPLDTVPGSHDGYTQPYFSWVPSIGVSNLIVSESPLFPLWKGDLIVSSLTARRLFRIRVRDSRVAMMEMIPIGERIRDIEQGPSGEILLWTDTASLIAIRPAVDEQTGEALFDRCAGCHALRGGIEHGFGPDLGGVVGRAPGTAPGFQYSEAMRRAGGRWTPERLRAFLRDPQAAVPGTSMLFSGISDPGARDTIVSYLANGAQREPATTTTTE